MRVLLTISALFIFSFSFSQKIKNTKVESSYDTTSLPFLDDFYLYNNSIDTTLWNIEGGGFLNNGYPISSPSLGVISLDGKQSDGVPYICVDYEATLTPEYSDSIDYFVTKAIDLSSVTSDSSLALSFFWQMGGQSSTNSPELEDGDSLHLYFLKRDSTWVKVWPSTTADSTEIANTTPGDPFQYKFISITDSVNFFHEGFRMNFTTYGAATGPYDVWSIDYIYLDTDRVTDSRLVDLAFNKRPTSLLQNYTSVPISHFKVADESIIADSVFSSMINISNSGLQFLEATAPGNIYETFRDIRIDTLTGINETQFPATDEETKVTWTPDKTTIFNAVSAMDETTPINLRYTISNKTSDTIPHNDTIYGSTYLNNYYAYDDGTAESGLGIFNFGQLAIQYNNLKQDTLEYIDIYFPKMEFNLEFSSINLKVWQSLDGVDGAVATNVIQSLAALVFYEDGLNQFYHYRLTNPIPLEPGIFYIGFEQNIQTRIYIGWDKNIDRSDKVFFQNTFGSWDSYQNTDVSAFGSPMIRPRFGTPDDSEVVSIVETSVNPIIHIFPNPTSDKLKITGNIRYVEVFAITGESIFTQTLSGSDIESINTSNLVDGIYLIKISGEGFSDVQRFVKE